MKIIPYIFITGFYYFLISSSILPSVDLPGHISLIRESAEALINGNLYWYDTTLLGGWVPGIHYAQLPYIIAGIICNIFSFLGFQNSAVLTLNILILFSLNALYFGVNKVVSTFNVKNSWIYSFIVTFWFLQLDSSASGIGASSIINTGLFTQGLAWSVLLLCINYLIEKKYLKLSFLFAGLIAVHPMTAIWFLLWSLLTTLILKQNILLYSKFMLLGIFMAPPCWLPGILLHNYSSGGSLPGSTSDIGSIFFIIEPRLIVKFVSLLFIFNWRINGN